MLNIDSKNELYKYQQLLLQQLGLCESLSPQQQPVLPDDNPFGQTISRMVKIQFTNTNQSRNQPTVIRAKQSNTATADKFYSKKKHNYSSFIREIQQQKTINQHNQQTFLTVGSHAIRKMDYASIFNKDMRSIDQKMQLRRKMRPQLVLDRKIDYSVDLPDTIANKVLIVRRRKDKIEDLLQPISFMQRSSNKNKMMTVPKLLAHNHQSIQDFIPFRKQSAKREPFVFGMGEKQQTSERVKERLTAYHDFIWKINYSNGLFVKPTEEQTVYKAYIGQGNNCNLIRSILRRRYWWSIVQKNEGCQFVWTQLKVPSYHKAQTITFKQSSNNYENVKQTPQLEHELPLLREHCKIFNNHDMRNWVIHMKKNNKNEFVINQRTYRSRKIFVNAKSLYRITNSEQLCVHNHFEQNYSIGNKKALFYNMRRYYKLQGKDVFEALPLTFHISKGTDDPQYRLFLETHAKYQTRKGENLRNIWIVKPGESSNRGTGITVCHSLEQIRLRLKARERNNDGSLRTFIIQKYMERPLLYKGRKFDIRHYLLLTCIHGQIKAYWFPEGYVRTASAMFTLKKGAGPLIHLTNDAIQKKGEDYSKHEKGNKVSYDKFQIYLNKLGFQNNVFTEKVLGAMKDLTIEAVKSCYLTLDPKRRQHNFELLGMDFMLDQTLKPWLIEINTNPCLQLSSPLLERLIPTLIEQTFRICVDPLFPPPEEWLSSKKIYMSERPLEQNLFQLIFDEETQGEEVRRLLGSDPGLEIGVGKLQEDAEEYQSDGVEWQQK